MDEAFICRYCGRALPVMVKTKSPLTKAPPTVAQEQKPSPLYENTNQNPFQKIRHIWNTSNIGRLIIVVITISLCGCCVVFGPILFPVSSTPDSDIKNTPLTTEIADSIFTPTPKASELPPTEEPTNTPLPPTAVYTEIPIPTSDPYMHIGGDWPFGIWDYIFKPERGARGHTKVYMGELKSYVFEIIGAAICSTDILPSGQGYLVRYPEGNEEWKDRRALEKFPLYVLKDEFDEIIRDFDYSFYQCP